MNTQQTDFEPLPACACSALADVMPAVLNKGWIHSMCASIDGTVLLQANLHDGRWIRAEIGDAEHIGAAMPDNKFGDFTVESLKQWIAQNRLGSGDGEGWTLLTRQIAFEPLPASVLFALFLGGIHFFASL